ncbi:MAG: type II toxin-antitoxin system RelE/ParE family toxin [Candidatus Symbiobacter sp.]|nr:type II toxin-antitoxin system RelE/ParE family toxin [Candidatus Symbiobacter sp.]
MAWTIIIEPLAKQQLAKLDKAVAQRIVDFLFIRVKTHPNPIKLTEPLFGHLAGLRRFRVGDYRLFANFNLNDSTIFIQTIAHRRESYERKKGGN